MLTTLVYAAANRPVGRVDTVKTLRTINYAIADGTVWVATRGRELIGSLGCVAHPHWFSEDKVLYNLWLWINPGARSYRLVKGLVDQAKAAARDRGLIMELSSDSGVDVARKRALYARLGFREIGAVFVGA